MKHAELNKNFLKLLIVLNINFPTGRTVSKKNKLKKLHKMLFFVGRIRQMGNYFRKC